MAQKKNIPVKNIAEEVEEAVFDNPNEVSADETQMEAPAEEVIQPPVKAAKPSGKFSEHLKATLVKHPHINNAWVNEKGEWHYSAKAGFKSYSREEILNG